MKIKDASASPRSFWVLVMKIMYKIAYKYKSSICVLFYVFSIELENDLGEVETLFVLVADFW